MIPVNHFNHSLGFLKVLISIHSTLFGHHAVYTKAPIGRYSVIQMLLISNASTSKYAIKSLELEMPPTIVVTDKGIQMDIE